MTYNFTRLLIVIAPFIPCHYANSVPLFNPSFSSLPHCPCSFPSPRCGSKQGEEDYRPLFENFVQDLLSTVNKPEWPAAELLLSLLGRLLVSMTLCLKVKIQLFADLQDKIIQIKSIRQFTAFGKGKVF